MKFLTYCRKNMPTRAGILYNEETIIDLTALLQAEPPLTDIGDLLKRYEETAFDTVRETLDRCRDLTSVSVALADVQLCAPILQPPTLRDASCFERHAISAGENSGIGVPSCWYKAPLFYFQNTNCISGPEDTILRKRGSTTLDYEAEVAIVIGKRGMDISAEQTLDHIFGLTIFNDWSDRARCSFEVGYLGLHKGKDTSCGLGPYIVTMDEFTDVIKDGKLTLKVDAWVDDVHTTDSLTDDMYWSLPQLMAYVSEDTEVVPGDVIGLGTVGTGCIFERPYMFPYLADGATVRIAVERIGTLRQYVGHRED